HLPAEVDVDVAPAGEAPGHVIGDDGVGVADAAEGLVREDHAEAEGVRGRVALPDGDLVGRGELRHQGREVQAAGAAANNCNFHVWVLIWGRQGCGGRG